MLRLALLLEVDSLDSSFGVKFQVLEQAGFVNVKAEDRTDLFVKSLEKELVKTEKIKDEFVKVNQL